FMLLHLSRASFWHPYKCVFCPVKRKPRPKPARFFIAAGDLGCSAVNGAICTNAGTARCAVPYHPLYCFVAKCVLVVPVPLPPWRCRWCRRWCCLRLDRADIDPTIHHPQEAGSPLIHKRIRITRVDCQAIGCWQMGEGGAAVILQWTEH